MVGRTGATSANNASPAPAEDPQKLQEDLSYSIPRIFDQAQTSTANHKKNAVKLHGLQKRAAECKQIIKRGGKEVLGLVGEKVFNGEVLRMVNLVVKVKKGVVQADRIGKFLAEFLRYMHEKEEKQDNEDDEDEDEDATTADRFTARILRHLFLGFKAGDKTRRYRVVHLISEMVTHLGAVDEDDYEAIKSLLVGRLTRDTHLFIRAQAAYALCKICKIDPEAQCTLRDLDEDDLSSPPEPYPVIEYLADSMIYGTSPEVRRIIMSHIPVLSNTLPYMLERARDTDATVRRTLYQQLKANALVSINPESLPSDDNVKPEPTDESLKKPQSKEPQKAMGFAHPRALSIQQREDVIRYGLRDREPSVKAAAEKLLAYWIDIINVGVDPEEQKSLASYPGQSRVGGDDGVDHPVKKEEDDGTLAARPPRGQVEALTEAQKDATIRLLDFLGMLDLAEPVRNREDDDEEETGQLGKQDEDPLAAEALFAIFKIKYDLYENLKFVGSYWTELTPEAAFLARVFADYCIREKDGARLDAMLPVVSVLAGTIQTSYNQFIKDIRFEQDDEVILVLDDEDEEQQKEELRRKEQVLTELLKLSVNLDYADENGRRMMHVLMRDMLSQKDLPLALIPKCLDVLRVLSANERDLIWIVADVVQKLRQPGAEDSADEIQELDKSAPTKPDPAVDLRCLDVCIGMFERVNGKIEDNVALGRLVKELIIPSVKHTGETFRKKGFVALGHCCLILSKYTTHVISLCRNEYRGSTPSLRTKILKAIFDIVMVHEHKPLLSMPPENGEGDDLLTWLMGLFKEEENVKVQALLAMGIAKLVLAGLIREKEVLYSLVFSYLSVDTVSNHELRQCLTYFFQVYCYSSPANQKNIQEVFVGAFLELSKERRKLFEDEVVVTSSQVAGLFLTWTDPTRLVSLLDAKEHSTAEKEKADFVQLHLAMDIFKAILKPNYFSKAPLEKDDVKVLYQLLPKLHLPESVDDDQIRQLRVLMDRIPDHRPFRDVTTRNAYNKFKDSILEKYEMQLEEMTEEQLRKLEMYNELFEFLDDLIPLDEEDTSSGVQTRNGSRKRRSCSIITGTDGDGISSTRTLLSGRSVSVSNVSKRPRLSTSNGYDSDVVQTSPPPPAVSSRPRAARPPRAPVSIPEVIEISSDSEDDQPRQPAPRRRANIPPVTVKQEPRESDHHNEQPEPGPEDTPEPEQTFDSIMDTQNDPSSEDEEDEVNDLLSGRM